MKITDVVLLLTGCISPSQKIPVLTLKNPYIRRKQYINSIKYYICNTIIENIVFCDNSNADMDLELVSYAKRYKKKFEWISFNGNIRMSELKGKGYGEGEIVEYAIKNSYLLNGREKYIIKITGRLIVENLNLLLKFSSLQNIYLCPLYKNFINTRIYMMPCSVYCDSFIDVYLHVDDTQELYLERVFAEKIKTKKIKYKKFVVAPKISGISGSLGIRYKIDLFTQIKNTIRMYLVRI